MSEQGKNKSIGVATLFDNIELKRFIKFYIGLIFFLEIIIFLLCFLLQLKPINIPFPWKYYFLASFLIPIAITFLLGIFVTAFNLFIFGNPSPQNDRIILTENGSEKNKYLNNFNLFISCIRQAPFLLGLLLLCVGTIIFSKLDTIIVLSRGIGGKAIQYVFIISGVVLAVGTVFGFVWLFMKYKLEKMKCRYEYKRDVMTNLGLLVMDDSMLIDHEGQIITRDEAKKRILEKSPVLISRHKNQ
ncbi:MAG: hypothetical protein PVJ20_04435 [Desulfobacterales bacterium]